MKDELFELLDFTSQEVDRTKKALDIWEIGPEEIKEARRRVEVFDLELEGVRKLLAAYVRELVDVVLAKQEGKKVLFTNVPAVNPLVLAPSLMSKDVAACSGGIMSVSVMSALFGYEVLVPIFEAAEERGMTPGAAHCSINKFRMGGRATGKIAPADLMYSWGFFCDESPKMSEALHELFGDFTVYCDQPQADQDLGYPDLDPIAVEYLAKELHRMRRVTEEVVGFKITDEDLSSAGRSSAEMMDLLMKITELNKADPVPLNYPDYMLVESAPARIMTNIPTFTEALKTLYEELKKRVSEGKGVGEKGVPRVLKTINSPWADPAMLDTARLGIAIPVTENYLYYSQRAKLMERLIVPNEDIMRSIAKSVLIAALIGTLRRRLDSFIPACQEGGIDGLLWLINFECRPMYLHTMELKERIKEELGLPILILEHDPYDLREYSTQQVRTRLEAFAEMLKLAKKAKTRGKQ